MQHAGQKQKQLFGFGCSMQHAKNHEHAQGSFLPGRTAAKMAFASSLLYTPVAVQLTSFIPACFSHSHQPKRFVSKLQKPADALQKISTLPIGQSVWCLHTGLTQKHFSIKLQTTLFQNSFGLFAFPYVVVSGQFERPRIPKQQILRDVLHDTFP